MNEINFERAQQITTSAAKQHPVRLEQITIKLDKTQQNPVKPSKTREFQAKTGKTQ